MPDAGREELRIVIATERSKMSYELASQLWS